MYRPKVPEHITSFQLAVLVISVFVVSLAIELVFNLPFDVLQILIYVDTFIARSALLTLFSNIELRRPSLSI